MGYHGPRYTWCNKREEGLISKKFDRVLINNGWLQEILMPIVFSKQGVVRIIYGVG